MQKHYYFTTILLLCSFLLHATHNRSGEIIFKKTGILTVEATVITYTKASSVNADRDTLEICWGDGSCNKIVRLNGNGNGVLIGPDLKLNTYTSSHTYTNYGAYYISMLDMNRNAGILNINFPSSENIPFYLEAYVRLMPDASTSVHSPIFLEPAEDDAFTFQPFSHVVNAFDADGDSLAYELITPRMGTGMDVQNYFFPDQISPSADNKIFLNPVTGEFFWDTPIQPGQYCIAILVKAYRNGILLESIHRDMTIEVVNQANNPPVIDITPNLSTSEIIDVTVGQTVEITMNVSDPDVGQVLTLSATGAPLENYFVEKATFIATSTTGLFSWTITPEYFRAQPYQIVFKARDDLFGHGLAATRVVRFRVNAVSGVEQPALEVGTLLAFPNPAADMVTIQLPEALEEPATLQLFDFQGKLWTKELILSGTTQKQLDLRDRPKGYYFMTIQTLTKGKLQGRMLKI